MLKAGRVKEEASLLQISQDGRISGLGPIFHFLLCGLAAHPGKGGLSLHTALLVHHLNEGEIIFAADTGIVLTKSGSLVDDTGTIGHGDIVIDLNEEGLLV